MLVVEAGTSLCRICHVLRNGGFGNACCRASSRTANGILCLYSLTIVRGDLLQTPPDRIRLMRDALVPASEDSFRARKIRVSAISCRRLRDKVGCDRNLRRLSKRRLFGLRNAAYLRYRRGNASSFSPLTPLDSALIDARSGKPAGRGSHATIRAANGTNRKQFDRTKACEESPLEAACYLCNTFSKTACLAPFRAVPLLRVQKSSVIVMLRRRGASRGRPVFRWFA